MFLYFINRLFLTIPTLFIIMLVNFAIIQTAPGGPVERFIAQINNHSKINGEVGFTNTELFNNNISANNQLKYNGSQGIDEEIIKKIEILYGFNLPLLERFLLTVKKFLIFDFGESFYQDKKVIDLIIEKIPVSLSLGIWSTFFIYLISIPLGIKKAISSGSKFDIWSSSIVIVMHAIPAFLFSILLIILFCGGNFLNIFPLRGLVSDNFAELNFFQKIIDYIWHITLPIIAITIGGFASLTFFCKNSFLEEINKNYVLTAYSKGLNQKQVLYKHIARNALLIVIAGLPSALIGIFFTSSLLIEVIFSLDGLGLLGYESALSRDYPVMFASLYIFTLIGLLANIIADFFYHVIDPRINFSSINTKSHL